MEATTYTQAANALTVTGFVATEPKVTNFEKASVVRFALSISEATTNKAGETARVSALMNVEMWVKNENLAAIANIAKGKLVAVEGQLKPQQWTAADGTVQSRVIIGARKVNEIQLKKKSAPAA